MFVQNLDKILELLENKGDAIAFEYTKRQTIQYIQELPTSTSQRLSE